MSNKRPDWRFVSCLLITLFAGCTLGPRQIYKGRQQYNEAVQHTLREEMLLNIVRLKYREYPEFFSVGGIVASYSFDGAVGSSLDVPEAGLDALGLSSGVSRNESPTISYNPKNDPAFLKALLMPTKLESLRGLARTGWSWERLFRTTVQYMNNVENATTAGGPTPSEKPDFERFQYLAQLFQELYDRDVIEFTFADISSDPDIKDVPRAVENLSDDFIWNALKDGYTIQQAGGHTQLVKPKSEQQLAFVIKPSLDGKCSYEMAEIRCLLDLKEPDMKKLEPEVHAVGWAFQNGWIQPMYPTQNPQVNANAINVQQCEEASATLLEEVPPPQRDDIVISTRSFLEILFYLSQGVNVPVEHQMQGLVTLTVDETGAPFDWNEMLGDMFAVHSCKKCPEHAAVAVPYKGYWFYLDQRDLETLGTFALLQQLYSIEVLTGGDKSPFVYTVGVGAR